VSDQVTIALITVGGSTIGAVLLFVRRLLPPRPASARDVAINDVWEELRQLRGELSKVRNELDAVIRERDAEHVMVTILTDSNDALTAAVERTTPPIVFTPAEQQAIDRAKAARQAHDDSTWPTLSKRPAQT
jgi:hypothetical protein